MYARTLLPPLSYKACGGERCFCDPYRARTPADPLAGYPRGAASGATQSHPKGSRARPGQQLLSDPQVPPCQRKAFAQAFSQKALPLLHCAPGGRLELCSRFKPLGRAKGRQGSPRVAAIVRGLRRSRLLALCGANASDV